MALKMNGSSKMGQATWKEMPYTPQVLMGHLEQQFVEHMVWEKWGVYDPKTHDDNDPATWTWHIDHIIPLSDLPHTSMQDENFKKAWALENLRPLWSKQNVLDGARRTRHKSPKRPKKTKNGK